MSRIDLKVNMREPLTPRSKDILKEVKVLAFGEDTELNLIPVDYEEGVLVLDNGFLESYPLATMLMTERFRSYQGHPYGPSTLYLDTESFSATEMWNRPTREFTRLMQYAIGDGEVILTTDYDEVIALIEAAPGVVAHNGHSFDFSTLYGKDSTRPLELALEGRVFDTKVHASLAVPAPDTYVDRWGRKRVDTAKPENAKVWLSLDNLSFQLGLAGKEGDLHALAKEFNPKGTLKEDLDYGLIPLDDPRFLKYAEQDVVALRDLTKALLRILPVDEYGWREQLFNAINAQISRNGWKVDRDAAQARADLLSSRKAELMGRLERDYGFPTEGKKPWASKKGRQAVLALLADAGITEETVPDWDRTDTNNLSLGGKVLLRITSGTSAEEMGVALAELMGQRTLPNLALDSMQDDGRVHPNIETLQRSGRSSVTKPGLTVWGNNDDSDKGGIDRTLDKAYFLADDDHVMVEYDFSNADQRVLAGYSGDTAYLARFEKGVDGHEINARIMFTNELYETDPKHYRTQAKAPGHAFTYGAGAGKLAATTGLPIETMQRFVAGMNEAYPKLARWTDQVRRDAQCGFVTNWWGRKMLVDRGREHSQAPALMGQSGTREIMADALIRMLKYDIRIITWIRATIHDAIVFSIPKSEAHWAVDKIQELMECWWGPGQIVHFPVEHGPVNGTTWREAAH